MTTKLPLPIRGVNSGRPILKAGYTGAFFLPSPIGEHVQFLSEALDAVLAWVPDGALKWQSIGAGSESWSPVKASTLAKCKDQLRPDAARKRDLTSIELRSGEDESDASEWCITIIGNPVDEELPDEDTLFEVSFPAVDYAADEADAVARRFMAVAATLPYRAAYLSPALLWSRVEEDEALTRARALAVRFPGFDVARNTLARSYMGSGVRGARWLTLLGEAAVRRLGGPAAVLAHAGGALDVVPFGAGVALRAGAAPALNKGASPAYEALRTMARVLLPITVHDEVALVATEFSPDDDEDFVRRWEDRFTD